MNSMTGYGTGRAESPTLGSVTVEFRSVNNRFLDVVFRLPAELSTFEPAVRSAIQKRLTRGKVYAAFRFDPIPGATEQYALNESLLDRLEEFCRSRGGNPPPEALLGIPGIVITRADESRLEELGRLVEEALAKALDSFEAERRREGELTREALAGMHAGMVEHLAAIEEARPGVVARYRDRLIERIDELLGPKGATLDPGRLEQEVALFADKADISEELLRLRAHLERLEQLLAPDNRDAKGRALDFLAQEILRETNTIGSKARELEITRRVLDLKNLVESMKEQIANVE